MSDIGERLRNSLRLANDPKFYMLRNADIAEAANEIKRLLAACDKLGPWMSAALEDPQVCKEMKADIEEWFRALEPKP